MSYEGVNSGRDRPRSSFMERMEMVIAGLTKVVETKVTEERNEPPNPEPGRGMVVAKRFYKKKPTLFFAEVNLMKADYWLMDME